MGVHAERLETRIFFVANYTLSEVDLSVGLGIGINNAGVVAGAMLDEASETGARPATQAVGGPVRPLSELAGAAFDINERGEVVGYVSNGNSIELRLWSADGKSTAIPLTAFQAKINDEGFVAANDFDTGAAVWSRETGVRLLGDGFSANDLNNVLQVVGDAELERGAEAAIWSPTQELARLGNLGWYTNSVAINDAGQITGAAWVSSGDIHAFRWTNSYGLEDLGTLPGRSASEAYDINNVGQIVGASDGTAFLYEDGVMYDLNALVLGAAEWTLTNALAINDVGQIVVQSSDGRGAVLTPGAVGRAVSFSRGSSASFTDADGSSVVVSMKGPGSGTLVFDGEGPADAGRLLVTGSTNATRIAVSGDTSLRQVSVEGGLRSFVARDTRLAGGFVASAGVGKIDVRSIADTNIAIGPGMALSLNAGDVSGTHLSADNWIKSIRAASWTPSETAGSGISTGNWLIASLLIDGEFDADVTAARIGTLRVGANSAGTYAVGNGVQRVTVGTFSADLLVGGTHFEFNSDGMFATPFDNGTAALGSFKVASPAANAFSGRIAAPKIRSASLGGVMAQVGAAVFANNIRSIRGTHSADDAIVPDSGTPFWLKNLATPGVAFGQQNFSITIM